MTKTTNDKRQTTNINSKIRFALFLIFASYLILPTPFSQAETVIGKFPSLLGSDGARAIDTDIVWLGELRDKEGNSKQTDADNDDGVVAELSPCGSGKVTFMVHLKKPGKTTGIAYLNFFADWNRDGQWAGSDKCAPEWALKNHPLDLSKLSEEISAVTVYFPAGERTEDIWYRTVISLDQKMENENGGGELLAGEVEDYGPVTLASIIDA